MPKISFRYTILPRLIVVSVYIASAFAQSSPKVFKLELKRDPLLDGGKAAIVKGMADHAGHHFLVEDLSIRQAVSVLLIASDKNRRIGLQLCKFRWDKPDRSRETDSQGIVSFDVKTQGNMKILVKLDDAEEPTEYLLYVLAADEVIPSMPSIFVPMPRKTN